MKTLRRVLIVPAAVTAVLASAGSASAQSSIQPTVTPVRIDGGWIYWLAFLSLALALVLVIFLIAAYMRYAPRFAKDEDEAKGIANLIERRWTRSGSDTADLLLSRASDAIQAKEHALAVELLDRVITLQPEWAEAWNRRATAFFLLDDTASAMADLRQVLVREPRHFGAWAGLGHIYMSAGDKTRALEAYRKSLALHPFIESLRPLVDKLTPEVDGRDI